MNHILRLQDELRTTRLTLSAVKEELHGLRAYLATEKFRGYERDGGRKDWIAIEEIDRRLRDILAANPPASEEETKDKTTIENKH